MIKKHHNNQGFTLIEMIVVIIIIAILAALGVPRYLKVVEKGRLSEGAHTLSLLHQAEQTYATYFGAYVLTGTSGETDWDKLLTALKGVSIPEPKYFNFDLTKSNSLSTSLTSDPPKYTIVLNRDTSVEAGSWDYTLYIDDLGQILCRKTASTPLPPDYSPANCEDVKF